MKAFFQSQHCRSRVHCKTCRDLQGGRGWRRSMMLADPALQEVDYACPAGAPWVLVSRPDPAAVYEAVKAHIDSLSSGEDVHGLKEELRLVEDFLALHERQTPCWKARQKARLVGFVQSVMAQKRTIQGGRK